MTLRFWNWWKRMRGRRNIVQTLSKWQWINETDTSEKCLQTASCACTAGLSTQQGLNFSKNLNLSMSKNREINVTLGAREDGAPDADISVPSASVCTSQEHDVFYIFNQKEKQLCSLERSFQSIITRCFWKEKDTRTLSLQLQRIKSLHICSLRQQLLQNHLILPNVLKLGQQFSPDRRDGFILGVRCQVWV